MLKWLKDKFSQPSTISGSGILIALATAVFGPENAETIAEGIAAILALYEVLRQEYRDRF